MSNRVVIVTGAAKGIGRSIALAFAQQGDTVVAVDRADTSGIEAELRAAHGRGEGCALDITDHEAVESAVASIAERLGGVDVLVNNAGIIARGGIEELTHAQWRSVLDVNLNGTFNMSKAVVPYMRRRGAGRIVNITSIAGKMGDITAAPVYGTSKGAVNTLTKSLARQLAEFKITVNAIAPHAVETDMSAEWSEEKRREVLAGIPLGRMAAPEEVAAATVFFASEVAGFITGEVLNLNGGALMD